jgi:tetratricopeptide (TPR) repeat protein
MTIDSALAKNPMSLVLQEQQRRVATAVDEYSQQQRLRLAILHASYIPREKILLDNLQRVQPGLTSESLRGRGLQSRLILWRRAQQQVDEQQFIAALETIKLVNTLDKSADSEQLQEDIEQHLSERRQQLAQNNRNVKINQLVAAVAADDLIAAEIMAQGFSEENQNQRLRRALAELQLKIDRSAHYVQLLIDSGQKYYTQGLLDKAIFSWQKAVGLDPDNVVLEQLLQRALLFQSNYRKLQDSPSQGL